MERCDTSRPGPEWYRSINSRDLEPKPEQPPRKCRLCGATSDKVGWVARTLCRPCAVAHLDARPSNEEEVAHRERMGQLSQRLQMILREAGHAKGSGVSTAGIKFVKDVASRSGLRNWPHVRDEDDYLALIAAVEAALR
jgi:hypothetical protein